MLRYLLIPCKPFKKLLQVEYDRQGNDVGILNCGCVYKIFGMQVVCNRKPCLQMSIRMQCIRQASESLLAINNPKRVGQRWGVYSKCAKLDSLRFGRSGPKQQAADWISFVNTIEQLANIFPAPAKISLEVRDSN